MQGSPSSIQAIVHPVAVVRLAGFPFDWLLELCWSVPSSYLEIERRRDEARAQALAALGGWDFGGLSKPLRKAAVGVQRALRLARELPTPHLAAVRQALPPPVAQALELFQQRSLLLDQATQAVSADEEGALKAVRERLHTHASHPRFQEAVFLQSPSAYSRITSLAATSLDEAGTATRRRENVVAMFLQRFCAKNDTNSYFGPSGVVQWGAEESGALRVGPELFRRVYLSDWAIVAVGRALADGPLPELKAARANPTVRKIGGAYLWQVLEHGAAGELKRDYCQAQLEPGQLALLRHLEEPKRLEQASAVLGRPVAAEVAELAEQGLVPKTPVLLPSDVYDPDQALLANLGGLPESPARDAAVASVRELAALRTRFQAAALPDRQRLLEELEAGVSRATGEPARRGGGQHYSDRLLLHEDCGVRVTGGPISASGRAAVQAILPLFSAFTFVPLAIERARLSAWFRRHAPNGRRVPLIEVEFALDDQQVAAAAHGDPTVEALASIPAQLVATFERALSRPGPGEAARLGVAELEAALAGFTWAGVDASYVSVDVMVERVAGHETVLLGECHGIFGPQSTFFDPLPDSDRLHRELRDAARKLVPRGRPAELIMARTHKDDARHPIGELDLEIGGLSSRPRAEVVRHCEVDVFQDERGVLRLDTPKGEIVPLITNFSYPIISLVSPVPPAHSEVLEKYFPPSMLPARFRDGHCPRLMLGDVVVRRASWKIKADELRGAFEPGPLLSVRAERLRRLHGLPRWVFAMVPGEPKPIYLDFHSPVFLLALGRLLGTSDATCVSLSEMLPGPNGLSLDSEEGRRTSEIRLAIWLNLRP